MITRPRMMVTIGVVLLITVGAAVLGGWWLGSRGEAAPPDPVIALAEDWPGIPYARIQGSVTITDDCVTVDGHLSVWPRGAHLAAQDDSSGIALPGGMFVPIGGALDSAGGSYDVAFSGLAGMIGADQAAAVRACATRLGQTSFVVVFPEA
ncbi:hypothetical protein FB382_001909 [Nocardioides ginsengisegetis]|uniref:Uncharacterized protein n=1 Tax=Nocardioides ginsengisegetis TaxID=661491 RepID=A0A7W3IZN0_9ACTN|nr:hypothetical protein [Nocardioides ginsengisegetis]MBA8803618.1 hypothetical protein [Nocardioides ginsengisegetis]